MNTEGERITNVCNLKCENVFENSLQKEVYAVKTARETFEK